MWQNETSKVKGSDEDQESDERVKGTPEELEEAERVNGSQEDLDDAEQLFDFALRELDGQINTKMPEFSRVDEKSKPTVTVLVSGVGAGQTSIFYKIGAMKNSSTLIRFGKKNQLKDNQQAKNMFNLNVVDANSSAELVSCCRKSIEQNEHVFIDFKNKNLDQDETKKIIDGLKRGFDNVEVIICLSAIHSDNFNERQIRKYKKIANGIIFSHLDLCLNFNEIINTHYLSKDLPLIFFGTGKLIPDDIEAANSERLLSGLLEIE